MGKGLRIGIFAVFSANIINLIFNLLTNFLLPKYLSIDSYSAIKTYQLYVNYVGVFALGFADGLYLRYGGKSLNSINKDDFKAGMSSFRIMMIVESILLIVISLFLKDKVFMAFALCIMTMNIGYCYKNFYQAVGEFKRYGHILNFTTIATFILNMSLLFLFKTDNYFIYLLGYDVIYFIIALGLEHRSRVALGKGQIVSFSYSLLARDIKLGFLLMVGNFSNIILSSLDRWFVKGFMDSKSFAYYSFAVSLEGFLNVCITPITVTLYNFFCNNQKTEDVIRVRRYVLIFGSIIVSMAFPAKFLIERFLINYSNSISIMFILFATQIVFVIIKGIYINLYKAQRRQNQYFFRLVIVIVIGAALNFVFYFFHPSKEAFAYATLLSAIIWMLLCIHDFPRFSFSIGEILLLIISVLSFIVLGIHCNTVIGFLGYLITVLVTILLLFRRDFKNLLSVVIDVLKRK